MPEDLLPDDFPEDDSAENAPASIAAPISMLVHQVVIPVTAGDGARFELLCLHPEGEWQQLLYWLPAMGAAAKHYLPMAEAVASRGIAVIIHEWRGYPNSVLIMLGCMLAPLAANMRGYLPGRRIGFAGNEARGLTADWARSARNGRYSANGMSDDLDALLATLRLPVFALRLSDDWLVPKASLDWLLGKMPQAPRHVGLLTSDDLDGQPADHFGWMKAPAPIVERLPTGSLRATRRVDVHQPILTVAIRLHGNASASWAAKQVPVEACLLDTAKARLHLKPTD